MRTKSIPQTRVIAGNTPQETAMLFNEAMTELADLNPKYERDGNVFWIYYTVVKTEAETIVEQHEMMGERAHCIDCPYLMRDLNRFGSIKAIRNATYEELMEVDGMNGKAAESIIEFFADSEK